MSNKCLVIVLTMLITGISATAQVLTIDSCYALAVRNYPLIKQYELIEKTKEYTLSNAGKAFLPQVSITAIEGYVFGDLPSFGGPGTGTSSSNFKFIGIGQVSQLIWDGGATKTQKKITKANAETEKASVDVSLYELRSRVNQLYFGILLVDEQLRQLEVQNSILNNNIDRIKKLNENGLAYKTDVDEIRVEQLKLDQQKTEFNYTRNGYTTVLSLLVGVQITAATIFQKPVINNQPADMDILRPELSFFKSQRNLANAKADMQRVNLMPKIGLLGAGVVLAPGLTSSGATGIGVAGLNASWNINGFYKKSNEKNLTQQELNKINVQEETFLFNTRFQASQSSADINKQKAILAGDDEIVSLRKSIRDGYQLKYDTGTGPLLDLLNATERESEARSQKALHEMQLLMTLYNYKTLIGN
ncbi:MAG TPA: TolC family protein [Flavitalea sp.]|nr:TolC family protein [Flavitalea sp.]